MSSWVVRVPDKHGAILRFFNGFQLSYAVFPSTMAHSTIRILPEMVANEMPFWPVGTTVHNHRALLAPIHLLTLSLNSSRR